MAGTTQPRNIVLRFDMRRSPTCPDPDTRRYQAALQMAAWADRQPVDVVGLSEHHDTRDGFLSAPLSLAGMMCALTQRVRVSVSALLVPLHDPLRLAEDIALIDQVAPGRFSATCGLGYRQQEYDRFGVNWARRGAIFDEKLEVMVNALSGQPFSHHGGTTCLHPAPVTPLQALLLVGGNSAAAARRAARFGLGFCPAIDDQALATAYEARCAELGTRGFVIFPREPSTTLISANPEKSWETWGEFLLYDALAYGQWRHPTRRAYAESFAQDLETLREEGKYRIVTPDEAVDIVRDTGSLHLAPLVGGLPIAAGWESLQLFEQEVAPHL
jgi:alkanesulfonate monooxygenase SsuD/methylene tetrahydromethanopterin reductase-like flavin-dependent oxidoreductase (luciferase family)